MTPFRTHGGQAVPLRQDHVDTDQLIPARFLRQPRSAGYGQWLLHDQRVDDRHQPRQDCVLNDPTYRGADILVAGENFGCGSSREAAVYALQDHGFRAVIASSFGDIFRNNALKNGLLTVELPPEAVAILFARLSTDPAIPLLIHLPDQTIQFGTQPPWSFPMDAFRKDCLLSGRDELGLTQGLAPTIAAFEVNHHHDWPWLVIPPG